MPLKHSINATQTKLHSAAFAKTRKINMAKSIDLVRQDNGLWRVTTVETTVDIDVVCTITDNIVPPPVVIKPDKRLWERKTSFTSLPVGSSAREAAGLSEAFSNTVIAMNGDTQCASMGISAGQTGFGIWGGIMDHPINLIEGNELTFRIETFFPVGFDFTGKPRLKFLRVHTESVGGNDGYLDLLILPQGGFSHGNEIVGRDSINNGGTPFGKPIVPGVWETYEVFVKFSATQGIYRVSQNGLIIYENTAQKTLKSSTSYSDKSYIFTYWNGGAPKSQHMFVKQASLAAT